MDAMGGILTNGLGGPACNQLIFGPLRLFVRMEDLPPVTNVSVGGGSHVRQDSNVQNIVQSMHNRRQREREFEEQDDTTPQARIRKRVVVTFKLNDKMHDKEFIVTPRTASNVVKVVNITNTITTKIRAFISRLVQRNGKSND